MKKRIFPYFISALCLLAAARAGAESVHGIVTEASADSFKLFRIDTSEPPTLLDLRVMPETRLEGLAGLSDLEKGAEVVVEIGAPSAERIEARSIELLATAEDTTANLRSAKLNVLTGDLAVTTRRDMARDIGLLSVRTGEAPADTSESASQGS